MDNAVTHCDTEVLDKLSVRKPGCRDINVGSTAVYVHSQQPFSRNLSPPQEPQQRVGYPWTAIEWWETSQRNAVAQSQVPEASSEIEVLVKNAYPTWPPANLPSKLRLMCGRARDAFMPAT